MGPSDGLALEVIPGSFNFRDMGGLVVEGGVIAPRRVFRSDLLHRTDVDEARSVLRTLDISRVVDLRTGGERVDDGAFPDGGPIEVVHVPVLADVWSWDDERDAETDDFLRDRTIEMYDDRGAQLVEALRLVATSKGPVVFHCTAGKDRTGAVASALLGVLGATREVIMGDYARSAEAMPAIIDWYRAQAGEHHVIGTGDDQTHTAMIGRAARPETMSGLVDHLIERYGSFGGWARHHGLSDDGQAELARTVVAPMGSE